MAKRLKSVKMEGRTLEAVNTEYSKLCTEFGDVAHKIRQFEKRQVAIVGKLNELEAEGEALLKQAMHAAKASTQAQAGEV